ncbi:hypothetical protein ACQPZK_18810 [Micromonospora sp. CA-249363]|jgi:hypothetical protein|uniref:hypothetical protein n=1 Tax=Micromonospora sp. CA-249363 TaxID=3239963 RepID=UPI003D93BEFB
MSGITPYSSGEGNVADRCRAAVLEIGEQVDRLRVHLGRLDPERLRMSPLRFQALLVGFDIYARMLDDALNDIVAELRPPAVPARRDLEMVAGENR